VTRIRSILGAAALLVGVAAPAALAPVLVAAPAQAAACTTQGVTVVVDFGDLGGGVKQACVSDGGNKTAATLFPAAGFSLAYAQRAAGAVCRVEGVPTSDPCVSMPAANAYWSLWWSDGHTTSWTYASLGVQSLTIPAGGDVAFSWQGSSAKSPPNVPATVIRAGTSTPAQSATTKATSPTTSTTQKPSTSKGTSTKAKPTSKATSPVATPSASASRSASPGASASAGASASGSATASASASVGGTLPASASPSPAASSDAAAVPTAATTADASDTDSGGLPGWVAPVVVVAVLGAGGGVAIARRRTRA
jgi:hypothetical protein